MVTNNVEAEYQDIVNRNAWPLVYQRIGQKCQAYPYTYNEALKPKNRPLNRYRDVNPYDHSRVILKDCEYDYINANYVKLERANRRYILTQGPLAYTVGHFWLMIWEQNSQAILMLNKVIEKNEIKCHWYWPHGIGEQHKMVFDDVMLAVQQMKEEDCNYYSTRVFRIFNLATDTTRDVVQYHYTTWPDFGVPTSPVAFLEFLKRVRESGVLHNDLGPPVVHCSAGIGRSGTFCLVDSCMVIIENEGVENVDIQEVLLDLRKDRMGLIQTPDQLRFSYQAIIEGIKRLDPNWVDEEEEEEKPKEKEPDPAQEQAQALALAQALAQAAEEIPALMQESVYSAVADEDEAPPPPPPRAESLTRAPARPLPAIPTSESLGNLNLTTRPESSCSSDDEPPTPPARESSSEVSSADEEDEDPNVTIIESPTHEVNETVRRRRNRELADRVSTMKRKARDAERWHKLKRLKMDGDNKEPRQD